MEVRHVFKPRQEISALDDRIGFRGALVEWFEGHGLDHPWRRTRDPYAVLVSEVMLQQTQVTTVLKKGYFERFLERFPDIETLAMAEDEEMLKAWEGLGYYRRVRMLRETARVLLDDHEGVFPRETGELMKLPGIGRYTAGALRAFAFREPAVLVDGNVVRVLARVMNFHEVTDDSAGQKVMWAWAGELADPEWPSSYHAGLMELGQRICRVGEPECMQCPVSRYCGARRPDVLPVKRRKVAVTEVDEHVVWARDARGRLLMQRESGKRRTGLWKLPVREAGEVADLPVILETTYAITRYRVKLKVHEVERGGAMEPGSEEEEQWHDESSISEVAMAAPFRKVLGRLLESG